MDERKIKCRKCRGHLLTTSCLLNSHNAAMTEDSELCEDDRTSTLWYVDPDDSPEWVKNCIDQGEWSSGKLDCPHCKGRLGSFDFVHPRKCKCSKHVAPSVWLLKSRVDVAKPMPHLHSHTTERASKLVDETWEIIDKQSDIRFQNSSVERTMPALNDDPDNEEFSQSFSVLQQTSSSPVFDNFSQSVRIGRQNTTKSRTNVQESMAEVWRKNLLLERYNEELKVTASELVQEKFKCPVCLELLFLPTNCYPCGHLFCEPCLRCWNHQNENKACQCPVCRTAVTSAMSKAELNIVLRRRFPLIYRHRKKLMKKYKKYPLPHQSRSVVDVSIRFRRFGTIYCIVVSVFIYAILFQLFQFVVEE